MTDRPWYSKLLGREWAELVAWIMEQEQRKAASADKRRRLKTETNKGSMTR